MKMNNIKMREKRFKLLNNEIEKLFNSLFFESFTEYKTEIETELIKIVKRYNVLSHFGKEWKVISSFNISDNSFIFDIRTIKDNYRVYIIKLNNSKLKLYV